LRFPADDQLIDLVSQCVEDSGLVETLASNDRDQRARRVAQRALNVSSAAISKRTGDLGELYAIVVVSAMRSTSHR
jgi:hypothetical protein